MRRALIIVAGCVLLLVVLVLIAASFLNVNRYRPMIEAQLQAKLNRPVTIGKLHLHFLPFSIRVDDLAVQEPSGFPTAPPFATAQEVYVSASLVDLLGGREEIHSLTLHDPQVTLIRNSAGTWNYAGMGTGNSQSTASQKGGNSPLTLDKLIVKSGRVTLIDQEGKAQPTVYDHIDLSVAGIAPSHQFTVRASVHFPGPGENLVAFAGNGGPLGSAEVPLQGAISSRSLQIEDVEFKNLQANLNSANGITRLSPFSASIFGGALNGNLTLNAKSAMTQCSVQGKLAGVDANALLTALSSVKESIYGTLNSDANLTFQIDSGANLTQTLNGTLAFDLTNGHLKNLDMMKELERVGSFLNGNPAQASQDTTIQKLSATLNIRDGIAETNNLTAILPEASLQGAGSLNLVNEAIDMHLSATLKGVLKNQPGVLRAALGNGQGGAVIPVTLTGSMAHPQVALDAKGLAASRLGNVIGKQNGAAGSILGSVLGQLGKKK